MQLERYDVTIRVSDPDDNEAYVEVTYRSGLRDVMVTYPVIGPVIKAFEESIK